MKTRIHPTATRLVGACLLLLLTLTGTAQRNEVLPSPKVVDPATGQLIPEEPVRLHPDFDDRRVNVDFDDVLLPYIVTWLRQVPEFEGLNFVMSPKLLHEVQDFGYTIKLRSANVRDILTALGVATHGQVWFEVLTPTLVALVPNPATPPAEIPEPPAHQVKPDSPSARWNPGSSDFADNYASKCSCDCAKTRYESKSQTSFARRDPVRRSA